MFFFKPKLIGCCCCCCCGSLCLFASSASLICHVRLLSAPHDYRTKAGEPIKQWVLGYEGKEEKKRVSSPSLLWRQSYDLLLDALGMQDGEGGMDPASVRRSNEILPYRAISRALAQLEREREREGLVESRFCAYSEPLSPPVSLILSCWFVTQRKKYARALFVGIIPGSCRSKCQYRK